MGLPSRIETTGFLNPTLSVFGCFSTQLDGARHDAHLDLRDHPDLAAWLLSILDHVVSLNNGSTNPRPIGQPPAGASRQALIEAGILFTRPRAGGVLEMGINPEFNAQLMLDVRRRDQPAHHAMLNLTDEPELSRWLLGHYASGQPPADFARLDEALRASLRRHSVLIDEAPAQDAWYPDPTVPADLVAELAIASQVFPQPAGQAIPAEVRRVLGKHTPALPPQAHLIWGQDAGTGMVYPTAWPSGSAPPDDVRLIRGAGATAAQRVAQWDRQREEARASVRNRRHAVLRDIVPPAQKLKLQRYVRQLRERGYFPALGDGQVALRASIHNQPTIASLHQGLAGILNTIGEEPVVPSYCYLSCYEEGSVLDRHLDRQQCAYNLCLVLDMRYLDRDGEPEPWPIYLELDGQPVPALLRVGDGIFFSGRSIYHWRDALPAGQRAVVCFYHFVPYGFAGSLD
jgi:hypothetical protein